MNIVIFANPPFFGSQPTPPFMSMPRFANMLAEGMKKRGHRVVVWAPRSTFFGLVKKGSVKKWLGYIDQYLVFPILVKRLISTCTPDTLFVFTDQAQGPWVPLVKDKHHVVHCHDFLAQFSALGKVKEQRVGWTGRKYQGFIRSGLRKAKYFISVSNKTHSDLLEVLNQKDKNAYVVYNGLDKCYQPEDPIKARVILSAKIDVALNGGYLLHVGGNQWYKNRRGVVAIYNAWRSTSRSRLPLLLVGQKPSQDLEDEIDGSPFKGDIHVVSNLSDIYVRYAYSGATLFLFPSLAEGFGWPIAEAMASGCPVLTTNASPMTEVGGNAAFLMPVYERTKENTWAALGAQAVEKVVSMTAEERALIVQRSIANAKRFDQKTALDQIEDIYYNIA